MPRIIHPAETRLPSRTEGFPVVVVDPGHGGQDSGAMCGGMMEKDLTLDVGQRLDHRLQESGISTIMTRDSDNYISLAERTAMTNRLRDCVFVSIHFNEGNKPVSTGIETYYAEQQTSRAPLLASWFPFLQAPSVEPANLQSQSLAGFIQEALVARTHAVNRGTKTQQFYVLANVHHPAVLVEGGFISNKDELGKLGSPDYREEIATAITDGILRYREVLKGERR
jgi:N-acetylmuramoyl-L-alanine amidase